MKGKAVTKRHKSVSYAKWGYIFIAPFFLAYGIFSLAPLIFTFYNSFYENYLVGLMQVGPNFVGLRNYTELFKTDILIYTKNTIIMWIMGFIPQIIVSMLLAAWFTDLRLRLKGQKFFKTVIYLPNLIMASAFAMLFFTLFSLNGPANEVLVNIGIVSEPYRFFDHEFSSRGMVAFINFLMWYGNTTVLLLAAFLGIDSNYIEAAEIDGASPIQTFFRIRLPLVKPVLVYVIITSMIGGLQMFDVPQILTNGSGDPTQTTMTLIMYLNKHLFSKNYGMSGALSVILFIICAILSLLVYKFTMGESRSMYRNKGKAATGGAKDNHLKGGVEA